MVRFSKSQRSQINLPNSGHDRQSPARAPEDRVPEDHAPEDPAPEGPVRRAHAAVGRCVLVGRAAGAHAQAGRAQAGGAPVQAELPFLAVYRIRAEVIEINRILHGAQKWP